MRLTEEQEMQAGHIGQGNDSYLFPKIFPITFLPYRFKQWRAIVWCIGVSTASLKIKIGKACLSPFSPSNGFKPLNKSLCTPLHWFKVITNHKSL